MHKITTDALEQIYKLMEPLWFHSYYYSEVVKDVLNAGHDIEASIVHNAH